MSEDTKTLTKKELKQKRKEEKKERLEKKSKENKKRKGGSHNGIPETDSFGKVNKEQLSKAVDKRVKNNATRRM